MSLRRGLQATSLATLLSRVLGMLRDVVTAHRFGAGGVMDALVLALRAPDLFRRLFGEGVLSASFVPLLAKRLNDPAAASRLLTAAVLLSGSLALLVVLLGEALCGAVAGQPLAAQLTAILLPYLVLICIVAQLAAALQTRGRFAPAALVSCILNLAWIAACLAAPWWSSDPAAQARMLAAVVAASGLLQVGWLAAALRRPRPPWRLMRPDRGDWRAAGGALRRLAPAALALGATQINTTVDSVVAWWLAAEGALAPGGAAAVYFGERLFMLPVGVVGVSAAVVFYPTLCQLAERQDAEGLARQTRLALQGIWHWAVPASVGLLLLSRPIVAVLLQRGEFRAEDTARAAAVVACYAAGIAAFAATPLLVRALLATGRVSAAARAAGAAVLLHAAAAPLAGAWRGEAAMAAASSAAAALQAAWLLLAIRRPAPLQLRLLTPGLLRISLSAAAMGLAARLLRPPTAGVGGAAEALRLAAAVGLCAALYLGLERLLRRWLPDRQSPVSPR